MLHISGSSLSHASPQSLLASLQVSIFGRKLKTTLQHTSIYNIFSHVCLSDEDTLTLCKSAILQSVSSHFTVALCSRKMFSKFMWHSDKKKNVREVFTFFQIISGLTFSTVKQALISCLFHRKCFLCGPVIENVLFVSQTERVRSVKVMKIFWKVSHSWRIKQKCAQPLIGPSGPLCRYQRSTTRLHTAYHTWAWVSSVAMSSLQSNCQKWLSKRCVPKFKNR